MSCGFDWIPAPDYIVPGHAYCRRKDEPNLLFSAATRMGNGEL